MRILVTLKISNSHFGDIQHGLGRVRCAYQVGYAVRTFKGLQWYAQRTLLGYRTFMATRPTVFCHNENCWPLAVDNPTQFLRKCHDRDSIRSA